MNSNSFLTAFMRLTFVFLLIALLYKTCSFYQENINLKKSVSVLMSENDSLIKYKDKQGKENSVIDVVEVPQESLEKLKTQDKINNIIYKTRFVNTTTIETLQIQLFDTLYVTNSDTVKTKSLKYKDDWISLNGTIYENKAVFDSITIKNSYDIESGYEKKWFLAKAHKKLYIKNINPYTSTDTIISYSVLDNKKWYQKTATHIAAGALITLLLLK